MQVFGQFPAVRMRRMRRDPFSRALMREHHVTASDLIYPVFILEGTHQREPVLSMPGVERVSVDLLLKVAEECVALGIPVLALFPVIDAAKKTAQFSIGFNVTTPYMPIISDGNRPKRAATLTTAVRNTRSTFSMPNTGWISLAAPRPTATMASAIR